jgi:hypothetical protein
MDDRHSWNVMASIMDAPYFWTAFAVILIAAELWAITRVLKSTSTQTNKCLWIIVLVFVPLFGVLGWLFFGPRVKTVHSDSPYPRN